MSAYARPRFAAAAALAWILAAPAGAPGRPCVAPRLLARSGAGRLGPDAPGQRSLAFRLAAPARVWAEAEGLEGLEGEDREEAPEVFLDDEYLGPLLPEQGSHWRSPLAVRLAAGWHTLLVRCSQPGGVGPALRYRAFLVYAARPCPGALRALAGPAPRPLAVEPIASPGASPPVRRRPRALAVRSTCGLLPVDTAWPARLGGRDLVLSSAQGRVTDSGPLARIRLGRAWTAWLKIPPSMGAKPFPLVARIEAGPGGSVRFLVLVDRDLPAGTTVAARGYRPGAWEPFTVWLCPGSLCVRFAREGLMRAPFPGRGATVHLGALGLTLTLSPRFR